MKLYNNDYFVDDTGSYHNDTLIKRGYLLSMTKSPHTVIKTTEGDDSGWFPSIIVAKPSWRTPVELKGSEIQAPFPCKAYQFSFTLYKDERTVIRLPKAFSHDYPYGREQDVFLNFYDLTGKIDPLSTKHHWGRGGFGYDSINNRIQTLHCKKRDVSDYFQLMMMSNYKVTLDLDYSSPCCATGKKDGYIQPTSFEIYKDKVKEFGLKKIISYK